MFLMASMEPRRERRELSGLAAMRIQSALSFKFSGTDQLLLQRQHKVRTDTTLPGQDCQIRKRGAQLRAGSFLNRA